MPNLDPSLFNVSSGLLGVGSPIRALHSEYEARLKSPAGSSHSGRTFTRSNSTELLIRVRSNSIGNLSNDSNSSPRPTNSKSQHIYSDRFIPSRSGSHIESGFCLLDEKPRKRRNSSINIDRSSTQNNSLNENSKEGSSTFSKLLKSELLGVETMSPRSRETLDEKSGISASSPRNLFRFKAPRQTIQDDKKRPFVFSPVGNNGESPRKEKRKIPKTPFKVLDAPSLQDDFYLNLVDWSAQNVLAVGLGSSVYLWSACTSKVSKLCDLGESDSVTAVAWTQRGTHLTIGTNSGEVQLWEATSSKKIRTMGGHAARVSAIAWNSNIMASGSRDRIIYQRDVRCPEPYISRLAGHKQEVCGLKWSFDDQQLASGGNDNKLFIWNSHSNNPVARFSDHTAAVKAIAWSPHQHGLLASGGGTADRCIRFWNSLTYSPLNSIDTGSQVCNLMWAKNVNEIVSTHGYSLNQIIVWKYPSMTKLATLTGHTYRVLYLAMSPDGQTVVTGAGDETLRFWNAFPGNKNKDGNRLGNSFLFPIGADIR